MANKANRRRTLRGKQGNCESIQKYSVAIETVEPKPKRKR